MDIYPLSREQEVEKSRHQTAKAIADITAAVALLRGVKPIVELTRAQRRALRDAGWYCDQIALERGWGYDRDIGSRPPKPDWCEL